MLKDYYRLAKPGIVYSNVFTTLVAYLYASRWNIVPIPFLATIIGLGLVIGSACVFNNYLDRDIDRKMARTKNRALVSGAISMHDAIVYGIFLALVGFFLLLTQVNILTAALAFVGLIFYVVIYGLAKRASHWGTVVGSVSGAVPIVVGYVAVTARLDATALLLFLILVVWQMPHFYAIAMYRLNDYIAAGIPILPAQKGARTTKIHIVAYIVAFTIAAALLTISAHAGYAYLVVVSLIGLAWLYRAIMGFKTLDDTKWARQLFLFSLVVLVVFSVMLSVAAILP